MVPILLSSIICFGCSSTSVYHEGRVCFEGYHLFMCCMALISITWIFICTGYMSLFYHTRNPFKFGFFSTSSNLWVTGKLLQKMFPPLFLVFDQQLKYNVLYIFGTVGMSFGYFFIFRFMYPYYRSAKNL